MMIKLEVIQAEPLFLLLTQEDIRRLCWQVVVTNNLNHDFSIKYFS